MKPPFPPDEAARLESLRSYEILDTPPDQGFDDLTLLAAQICEVPMAMVSLVDENRQWFKSKLGVDANETSRDIAFCAHTILHRDRILEVRDPQNDVRFAESPLVTADPHVRFYAGAPLVTPAGHALGALCVMDRRTRCLTIEQKAALEALSRRVVAQLELRQKARQLATREQEANRLLVLANGARLALLGVLEDEKLAAKSLRESEERFRQLAENINEVFWITDPAKNLMLYISPGYEKIWGRTCQSLYDAPATWLEAIHGEDRARIRSSLSRQAAGTYNEEYRIIRPDGTERWVRDRAFPVRDSTGAVQRVVGVAEDITESRQIHEQFLRAQRMEAIGTLAGGIAHDLNNILAPVMMVPALLRDFAKSEHELKLLDLVEQGARRGSNIVRQLLTFSRGAGGERVSVQLRHLVREMIDIMHETFPRDIAVENDMSADLQPVVGDATQLHQVVLNLCVNARDAMPQGGKLSVAIRNVILTAVDVKAHRPAPPGPYVALSVEDTGHGIPPDIIDRIFDPFFTTKGPTKGTGLGLSTVLGIVRSHGGFITVSSIPDRGTKFVVYLPTAPVALGTTAPMEGNALPAGEGELILVVDDEAPVRVAMQHLLERHGYRVLVASEGSEALTTFLQNRDTVRLVFTDLMMPVMGGLPLILTLRALEPDLSILATSGLTDQVNHDKLRAAGVDGILEKPCSSLAVLEAIRHELLKQRGNLAIKASD